MRGRVWCFFLLAERRQEDFIQRGSCIFDALFRHLEEENSLLVGRKSGRRECSEPR